MAIDGQERAHVRADGAVIAPPRRRLAFAPRLPQATFGRLAAATARQLRQEAWAARGPLWLPVGFALGILIHGAAETEPSLIAALGAAALTIAIAVAARARPAGFALAVAVATMATGFAAATLRTALVAHPTLAAPTGLVTVSGFVADRDQRERSDRIVLVVTRITPALSGAAPRRVRLVLRPGTAPAVGAHVAVKTRLQPLPGPVRPGGYDFAREAWFAGLGATGLAFGAPATVPTDAAMPWPVAVWAAIERLRLQIGARIRAALPGEPGAIAQALVTGERDAISERTNDILRISGIYHVISISGLHMVLVVGTVFALVRGGLALIPALAMRRPIKKWAALAAIAAAAFYLVLSGAEVATLRAFLMTGLVLVGVLVDRAALTLRTLAGAALLVMAVMPESVGHPGFQMSFAATLALIALYEAWAPHRGAPPAAAAAARLARRAVLLVAGLALTSLVAGLATAPFIVHHFHRVSTFSMVANLLTMPIVSAVVMPAGLAGVLAMPFGFDRPCFALMGQGIDAMLAVATWVAHWPGADARIAAAGPGMLLAAVAALLVATLPVGWLRLVALPLALLAGLLGARPEQSDVLVDPQARLVAVRGADGRLVIVGPLGNRFAARAWLDADGDVRAVSDPTLTAGVACDASGCVARLADGRAVAVPTTPAALEEDCARAALVVTRLTMSMPCAAMRIDPTTLTRTGAVALVRSGPGWSLTPSRDPNVTRPWLPAHLPAARAATPADRAPAEEDLDPAAP